MDKSILIISPHPDDETLGCGGTLLKYQDSGYELFWCIVTNIDIKFGFDKESVEARNDEIKLVAKMYNFKKRFILNYPPAELDTIPLKNIMRKMTQVIIEIKPSIIFLPNHSDVHTDHQISFKATYGCTKNFRFPFIKRILMYETMSETEFSPVLQQNAFMPNVFVDTTSFHERKCSIMEVYKTELMDDNLPRSINALNALARYRGTRIGVLYAEAFVSLHEIMMFDESASRI